MALTKAKKQEVLETLKGAITDASSIVFVNFHGTKVEDVNAFRSALRENGGSYTTAQQGAKPLLGGRSTTG